MAGIRYSVSFPQAEAHLIDVSLRLDAPDPGGQVLTLPNWIPGSYMIRDFSRNLVALEARDGEGRPVTLEKLDKSSWRAPPGLDALSVDCRVYAWDLSVRTAHVDRTHAFFNGTSVFLRPEGRDDGPIEVDVERPAEPWAVGWRVATAMRASDVDAAGFGRYRAEDYDELIDHPFELGTFTRLDFEVCGVPHEIVLSGHAPFDEALLVDDLTRICEHHVRFFGEPAPMERYVFLATFVDAGYGGLEHRASTALLATRDDLPPPRPRHGDGSGNVAGTDTGRDRGIPRTIDGGEVHDEHAREGSDAHSRGGSDADVEDATGGRDGATTAPPGDRPTRDDRYVAFLGLCSHEYFHTWNVKRVKPARFVPYELASESYTRLLWFFEGITSYYDDLALVRAGLIDRERYATLLARTITRVRRGAGRRLQSVSDSSFDAWHKFYKQDENAANAIVSYYAKGALVALCLDARLREASGGAASLDTLMRAVWARWLESGAGLAEDEPERLAAEIACAPLDDFFDRALRSTEDLPLEDALATLGAGLSWRAREGADDRGGKGGAKADDGEGGEKGAGKGGAGEDADTDERASPDAPPWLGATLAGAPDGAKVTQVASGGPAERAGLAPGDRLVAIGRLAFAVGDIDAVLRRHAHAGEVVVHHFRLGRLLESTLPIELPPRDTAVVSLPDDDVPLPWLDAATSVT